MKRVITSLLAILFVLPMVFPLAACTTETGGENMANYLYNGVELPELPEYDESVCPYAIILLNKYGAYTLHCTSYPITSDGSKFTTPRGGYKGSAFLTDGVWDEMEIVSDWLSASATTSTAIWANHDIIDTSTNSVILAASTPVPVGGSKLTISTGGSANGDGMALYNGVMFLKLPDYDKTKYPYATVSYIDYSEYVGVEGAYLAQLHLSSVEYHTGDGSSTSAYAPVYTKTFTCTNIEDFLAENGLPADTWIDDNNDQFTENTATAPSHTVVGGANLEYLLWANHDILKTADSSVAFSASDPIPLDGMNVITWDGDTTGLTSVADYPFYKVTNDVPDEEVLENGFVYVVGGGLIDLSDSVETNGDIVMLGIDAAIIAKTDGAVLGDIPFPEKGIYFPATDGIYTSALAYPASSGGGVTDTTATVNFSCKDLLYTDSVYRIKAWVYEPSGWSYNGVELPALPDLTDYPYYFMGAADTEMIIACTSEIGVDAGGNLALTSDGNVALFGNEDGCWVSYGVDAFKSGATVGGADVVFWSSYDLKNADGSVYLAASDPVPGGLDVTQPATWTSDLFAGPSHSESHTFTGLTPATEYGIYAVIWSETDGAATEHNATATFTTLEGEAPAGTIQFGAVNITGTGFTAVIEASGLDDATAYTAEIVVYNTATSAVAAEAVRSFTGNYTMAIDFAGLTPETDYTVAVDVYPTDTGKVVARGEFPVATGQEEPKTSWRDSFLLGFASGLGCTAATKTDADNNAWMQGYIVGDALRAAITTQQGFQYEVPDLQATVRMVAECFPESGDTLLFNAHNGSMILGVSTPNEATFTDRTDVTKYLIPIPAEASKVTVETSDPKVTLAQFVGVNGSGGNYTKVFSSAREAVYSYEFPKGAAQYMAIDLIYEDKGAVTVPWDYDATATTTVTFT